MIKTLSIIALVLLFSHTSFASSLPWWEKREEGWFFYKEEKKKKNPKKQEEKKEEAKPQPKSSPPNMLFSERMEKRGKELLSAAIERPSEENVRRYMEHNKKMLELSQNFAFAWQKTLMKHDHLNYYPREHDVGEAVKKAIASLRDEAGLYFFYSASCNSCQLQADQLVEFSEKHDFAILPVSVDGSALPQFPNTVMDNGVVSRLGIQKVPALFLVFPREKKIEPISSSYISSYDLERRLMYYVKEVPINTEEDAAGDVDDTVSFINTVLTKY